MVMDAFGTAAYPSKLQRKLRKRWRRKWEKFFKRTQRKDKLATLTPVLRKALQDHGDTVTIGELRAMVGKTLGITLEGKYRVAFDLALPSLTAPPPIKCKHRCRFKLASKRAKHDQTKPI